MRLPTGQRSRSQLSASAMLTLLLPLSTLLLPASAKPFPKDDAHNTLGFGFLMGRNCATYCGIDNQYCCPEGQACTTSAGVAGCTDTANGGGYVIYTTTWTETDTYTSTFSSYYYPANTAPSGGTCTPPPGSGEIACGPICCASWQHCAYDGQCNPNTPGGNTPAVAGTYTTTMTTDGITITTQFSAPYRVTSRLTQTTTTATNTGALASATAASSSGNGTAVATGGKSLSGGAIAGIVIGVIAGVCLLLAVCACCILRGLWHGLMALVGLAPQRRERSRSGDRETIIEEERRYRRRRVSPSTGGRHSNRYASRPVRSAATDSRRVSGVSEKRRAGTRRRDTAAMGTMLRLLGLRRDKQRRQQAKRTSRARSAFSNRYYPDAVVGSRPGSSSPGERAGQSRRSRRTETTRISRTQSRR